MYDFVWFLFSLFDFLWFCFTFFDSIQCCLILLDFVILDELVWFDFVWCCLTHWTLKCACRACWDKPTANTVRINRITLFCYLNICSAYKTRPAPLSPTKASFSLFVMSTFVFVLIVADIKQMWVENKNACGHTPMRSEKFWHLGWLRNQLRIPFLILLIRVLCWERVPGARSGHKPYFIDALHVQCI